MEDTIVFSPSRWHPFKRIFRSYQVTQDALILRQGMFSKREQRIPREKITNVDVRVNLVNPGTSSVHANTGSGESIACVGLTKETARALGAALTGPS